MAKKIVLVDSIFLWSVILYRLVKAIGYPQVKDTCQTSPVPSRNGPALISLPHSVTVWRSSWEMWPSSNVIMDLRAQSLSLFFSIHLRCAGLILITSSSQLKEKYLGQYKQKQNNWFLRQRSQSSQAAQEKFKSMSFSESSCISLEVSDAQEVK